jgi:hypothetical protein
VSKVINFPRGRGRPAFHPAARRLQGLTNVLSDLHGVDLQSQQDMRRALWILDLTNRCVQIVLSDFKDDPSILELTRQAEELINSVATARQMVDQLGSVLHGTTLSRFQS